MLNSILTPMQVGTMGGLFLFFHSSPSPPPPKTLHLLSQGFSHTRRGGRLIKKELVSSARPLSAPYMQVCVICVQWGSECPDLLAISQAIVVTDDSDSNNSAGVIRQSR